MEKSHVGMSNCFFCGEPNQILLDRQLKNRIPQHVGVIDMTPCSECEKYVSQGIIIISIADDTTPEEMQGEKITDKFGNVVRVLPPNPYRTGGWAVVTEEGIERFAEGVHLEFAKKRRFIMITSTAWNALGFEPKLTLLTKEDIQNREGH